MNTNKDYVQQVESYVNNVNLKNEKLVKIFCFDKIS